MPTTNPEQYSTVPETAAIFILKPKTTRAWIGQGRLGCAHFGRAVRVPMSEIFRLIDEGSTPAWQV